MAGFRLRAFRGTVPRLARRLLQPNQAQSAKNGRLFSGELRAFGGLTTVNTPTKVGTKLSIYRWGAVPGNAASGYWFHWTSDVNVARGPIAGDTLERTYWTGDGAYPKVTDASLATAGGGTDYPNNHYRLGIPAPSAAPTVTVSGTPPSDTSLNESRAYVYTYVSGWGEEGPPSPPSAVVTVGPAQTAELSGMSVAPAGAYNITTKRIYRVVTSDAGSAYQFVASIAVATTTYNDTLATANLGEVLPSAEWVAPPDDLKGLVMLPNGVAAGFRGNELCFSVPYQPHAWPIGYRLTTDYPIVSLGYFDQSIVVTTVADPYLVTGIDPQSMSMSKLALNQACVSKRGTVSLGTGVIYPSPDGLVMVGMSGAHVITEGYLSRDEWQAFKPESIHGYQWNGRYVGFYNTGAVQGAFIFDPRPDGDGWMPLDINATAGYSDPLTDTLYLQVGANIQSFDTSATKIAYQWRSPPLRTEHAANMGVAQVLALDYGNLTLKLYADGVLKHTRVVTGGDPFWLPGGYLAHDWEVDLTGTSAVESVALAEGMEELVTQ